MEILKTINASGIILIERWNMESVRSCCIKHDFYNNGDNTDYSKMMWYVEEHSKNPTIDDLYTVAKDIYKHTYIDESWSEFSVTTVMFYLERECIDKFYYTASEYYD